MDDHKPSVVTWFAAVLLAPLMTGCGSAVVGEDGATAVAIWRLEEELRIGGAASHLDLRGPLVIHPDSSGLYFAERGGRAARINATGELIYRMGGPGDGPGEFGTPQALQLINDTLWILDNIFGTRIEGFHDGSAARSIRPVIQTEDGPLTAVALNADGTILVESRRSRAFPAIAQGLITTLPLVRATREGVVIDTIVMRPVYADDYFPFTLSGGSAAAEMPVRHSPLTALFPDGSAVAVVDREVADTPSRATYGVTVYHFGAGSRKTEIDYVPIAAALSIPSWLDQWTQRLEEIGRPPDVVRVYREAILERSVAFPYLPPVSAASVGDGFMWLRREMVADHDSVAWDILETQKLTHVARAIVPKDILILFPAEEWVWASRNDSLDVPELIRFRIRR